MFTQTPIKAADERQNFEKLETNHCFRRELNQPAYLILHRLKGIKCFLN